MDWYRSVADLGLPIKRNQIKKVFNERIINGTFFKNAIKSKEIGVVIIVIHASGPLW